MGGTDMQTFPIIWSLVINGRFQQQTGHQNLTETAKYTRVLSKQGLIPKNKLTHSCNISKFYIITGGGGVVIKKQVGELPSIYQ